MRRRGISLVELMVVLAIIGILLALLFPAVQYSREAARRLHCSSNLRQVALAIHQYESVHRLFPAGSQRGYSYLVAILPYVDQEAMFSRMDFNKLWHDLPDKPHEARFPLFICPSDEVAVRARGAASYSGNMGFNDRVNGYVGLFHPLSPWAHNPNPAAPPPLGSQFGPHDVTDGLSNTTMLGEILVADWNQNRLLRTRWWTANCFEAHEHEKFLQACLAHEFAIMPDGTPIGTQLRGWFWIDGNPGVTLYTHSLTPNQLSCENCGMTVSAAYTLASRHSRGVLTAFADGSVHFVGNDVNVAVRRAQGTRNLGD